MPTPRRRGRTTPTVNRFRNCVSCGCGNSIRRASCLNCGNPLKKTRSGRAASRRNSGVAMDNQDELMETSFEGQEIAKTAEEGSAASSPPPSHHSHPSTPPTHSEEQSITEIPNTDIVNTATTPEEQSTVSPSIAPQNTTEDTSTQDTESQVSHSPPTHQPTALPDFLSALQMKPTASQPTTVQSVGDPASEGGGSKAEEMDTKEGNKESLMERYQKDPGSVLQLLQSVLSLDKLSQLLSNEHSSNAEQLEQLQTKLEGAYKTLKDSAQHKAALTKTIGETNDRIKGKRKHLEDLRDDLRVLGEEEMALKKRRDSTHTRCSQLKQKLKASREALQQIAALENPDSVQTKESI
ncbi:uncharacterized protein LOC135345273 [Halichondria panicea]|uniref:uncharacterized protein LOC135345273 n=1 Tax=Halichondria panicea TaxID=6063 RepID=UPI00312B98DE